MLALALEPRDSVQPWPEGSLWGWGLCACMVTLGPLVPWPGPWESCSPPYLPRLRQRQAVRRTPFHQTDSKNQQEKGFSRKSTT